MTVITGWGSAIAVEFRKIRPSIETVIRGRATAAGFPMGEERYLFCQGLLRQKPEAEQTPEEILEGMEVNYGSIVRSCIEILSTNESARICVIGSESGYLGSFDGVYAKAKADLHAFIESERIGPHQQLVGISPGIIEDAGMTIRRTDVETLDRRRATHPKGRFVRAAEVAYLANQLLFGPLDYVTGTVIRMNGGLNKREVN